MEILWDIDSPLWQALDLEALGLRAVSATLQHVGVTPELCEVSVLATTDARQADLNSEYRGKPAPTNVLSWPAQTLTPDAPGHVPPPPRADAFGEIPLGDLALAWETCVREADEFGRPLANHVTHLIVHGILHLLGYDHIRDPDATLMERTEVEILGKLGIDDPYCLPQG